MVLGLLDQPKIFWQLVSDRIARVLTDLGLLELQSLIYQRLLTGKNYKLKSYGISGQIVGLISSFVSNRWLQVVVDEKPSQEYPVNTWVSQRSILCRTLFLVYNNVLPVDVTCDIGICANDTTLYSKCDQGSDQWQQLELASELESDLWDTGLGQVVACWFQCWNSASLVWLV